MNKTFQTGRNIILVSILSVLLAGVLPQPAVMADTGNNPPVAKGTPTPAPTKSPKATATPKSRKKPAKGGDVQVVDKQLAVLKYSISAVGKDSKGNAFLDGVNTTWINNPDDGEQYLLLEGALLPKVKLSKDSAEVQIKRLALYVVGGKSYVYAELTTGDEGCRKATSDDAKLIAPYLPAASLNTWKDFISGVIAQATTVYDEERQGVTVKTSTYLDKAGLASVSMTRDGKLFGLVGSVEGKFDFYGETITGNYLLNFETQLEDVPTIELPEICN